MYKNYFILPLLLILGFFFSACNSDTTNPVNTPPTTGSIYIQSTPGGAQIWVDGTNSTNVTPDSVIGLSAGNHLVTLKLATFFDDTATVPVNAGYQAQLSLILAADYRTLYDNVQVWESQGTSASQPSGIILKSGTASSIQNGQNAGVDIYYSTFGGLVLASMFSVNARPTSFFIGASTDLFDRIPSPAYVPANWVTQISDQTTNYFYLYDNDQHFSKMIITDRSGTGVAPKWLKLRWYYNINAVDQRF